MVRIGALGLTIIVALLTLIVYIYVRSRRKPTKPSSSILGCTVMFLLLLGVYGLFSIIISEGIEHSFDSVMSLIMLIFFLFIYLPLLIVIGIVLFIIKGLK